MSESPLIIPPRPQVLMAVQQLMREDEPDIEAIAKLIKEDISLYTILLSAVNSPWMGLAQPATSVEQSIMLMGLDRVYTLVQAAAIRNSFGGLKIPESFWTAAIDVAGVCSSLANRYTGVDRNSAYSTGMLHNAGIAILMKEHPEFKQFLKEHGELNADELCIKERDTFDTDHFLQGALMAKEWFMGEDVALAIRYQPLAEKILSGKKKMKETVTTQLAVLTLAKSISAEFRRYWSIESDNDTVISSTECALDYLHINHSEFEEVKEDMLEGYMDKVSA